MPISNLFYIGNSALTTSKVALEVTSNNIANINNEEYHRQDVILEVAKPVPTNIGAGGCVPSRVGGGVLIGDIRRRFDQYLEAQCLLQTQNIGKDEVHEEVYSLIEENFNEQFGVGLKSYINDFFNAWNEISASPSGATQRVVLLSQSEALLERAKDIEQKLDDIQDAMDEEIPVMVDRINEIASEILYLNEAIAPIELDGVTVANDLRDRRDGLLKELSTYVDFDTVEDDSGRLNVIVGHRNIVSGGYTTHDITMEKSVDNKVEVKIEGIDVTDKITNGRLGGILELRNSETIGVPRALSDVRTLMAAIQNETNIIHSSGFGINAQQSDFSITNTTPSSTTTGVISGSSITDFNNFVPGDYNITFTGAATYDVYRNGQLYSSSNAYTSPTISLNGMDITFSTDPASGDTFNLQASGNDFFNPLSVYTLNKTTSVSAPATQITSATIYDRTALTYKEYEVTFTSATTYNLYDIKNETTTTGTLNSANAIVLDGMEITFDTTVPPGANNVFVISPIKNSITNASVLVTETDDVAASGTYTGLPGDNTNALAMVDLSNTQLNSLSSLTIDNYYDKIVTDSGTWSRAAKDTLTFDEQLLYAIKQKRDSVSAVNLDEEAMNLIRYQKAFEAASRIIQTADDIISILVNLGR